MSFRLIEGMKLAEGWLMNSVRIPKVLPIPRPIRVVTPKDNCHYRSGSREGVVQRTCCVMVEVLVFVEVGPGSEPTADRRHQVPEGLSTHFSEEP